MDSSEVLSLHLINFNNKYRLLQRKKIFFIQKYLESQMNINLNYMQIMENYRKIKDTLNLFQYECTNPAREIFLKRVIQRRIWQLDRKSNFWEDKVPNFSEEKFKHAFRMGRKSFNILCNKLFFLKKEDTNKRKAITLGKRIAIALYALGSLIEYRAVANLFGVGRTTVGKIVLEFCTAVCDILQDIYINSYPPSDEQIREIVSGFQNLGFPQCYGAIDGCHIKITPHKEESTCFYNSKGWYSVILFASVDYRCRFTYINVGTPGCNNDSSIFESSDLKRNHEMNAIFHENYKVLENTKIPIFLIGDSGFNLSKILMTPYPIRQNQSEEEKTYNKMLLKCRSVIDTAFDQLKARFRKIGKGLELRSVNSSTIIKACCVLHNFLIDENDHILSSWLKDFKEAESGQVNQQPHHVTDDENDTQEGNTIRKALSTFFYRRVAEKPEMDSGAGDGDSANRSGAGGGSGDVETFIVGGKIEAACSGGVELAVDDVDGKVEKSK